VIAGKPSEPRGAGRRQGCGVSIHRWVVGVSDVLDAVREERLEMMRADQDALFRSGSDSRALAEPVLRATAARLKEIINQYGYPGRGLVGDDGAHAVWLIVQHADFDREFQQAFFERMEDAARRGEATFRDVAFLTDRVCVGAGCPQAYGTQCESDGEWTRCRALDAPDGVDARRTQMGLEPLAQYVCCLGRSTSGGAMVYETRRSLSASRDLAPLSSSRTVLCGSRARFNGTLPTGAAGCWEM